MNKIPKVGQVYFFSDGNKKTWKELITSIEDRQIYYTVIKSSFDDLTIDRQRNCYISLYFDPLHFARLDVLETFKQRIKENQE